MNSTEFAEYQPTLNVWQARKILIDHGIECDDEFWNLGEYVGGARYWLTQDVFNWLGY